MRVTEYPNRLEIDIGGIPEGMMMAAGLFNSRLFPEGDEIVEFLDSYDRKMQNEGAIIYKKIGRFSVRINHVDLAAWKRVTLSSR